MSGAQPTELPHRPHRLDWGREGLGRRAQVVVARALEALLADQDAEGRLVPASRSKCEAAVHEFSLAIGAGSAEIRRGFGLMVLVLEWLPLLLVGRASRMSRLSLAERIGYLEALERSRFGLLAMLFVAFKIPLCLIAFEEPGLLGETGFDRPDLVTRRRLVTLPTAAEPAPDLPRRAAVEARP